VVKSALLPPLALLLTLAFALSNLPAKAEPALAPAKSSVTVEKVSENLYRITLTLPPFASLESEKVACAYEAQIKEAKTEAGAKLEIADNCLKLTIDNPSSNPLTVQVEVTLSTESSVKEEPPLLLAVAAAVAAGAASYLTLTENGRAKLFKAVSIPAAYYVVKYSDVARSAKRVKILEYVKANPGATMRRISRETGISFGEIQWHLSVLERLGLVERARVGKYVCYYPKGAPPETWLPAFAERELGLKLNPEDLKRATPKLEAALAKGAINLEELATLAASAPGS
jgi:DNA-binding transcriptional ArsR family regulator